MLDSVLAQQNPGAASLEDIYTVPVLRKFEGKVIVANRSATATAFRVALAPDGAVDDPSHYIAYDVAITGNAKDATPAFTIPEGCVVRVYATLATLTFTLTGLSSPAAEVVS